MLKILAAILLDANESIGSCMTAKKQFSTACEKKERRKDIVCCGISEFL